MAHRDNEPEYRFELLNNHTEPEHFHQDIEVFFTLTGEASLTVDGDRFPLPQDQILVVNPNRRRSFSADQNTLVCRFTIPLFLIRRYVPQQTPLFWCSSVQDSQGDYDCLREILRRFLNARMQNPERPSPLAESCFYALLDCLCSYYLLTLGEQAAKEEDQESERLGEITTFIEENYDQHISLNDLADRLHLTYSYLSRYFKKTLGVNFLDYVNQVRLRHAAEDLLYTDKPITHVAVDNGFVSSSGLNKAFKEAYDMTPTAYKAKMKAEQEQSSGSITNQEKLLQQVKRYLSGKSMQVRDTEQARRTQIRGDGASRQPYHKHWEDMINIGRATDLLKARVQKQTLFLCEQLGFRSVRFWGIFDEDMELRDGHDVTHLNFDKLDEILDFLVQNNLTPFIEFGNKPMIIFRDIMDLVMLKEGEPIFRCIPEFRAVLSQFFHHLVTRYRAEKVRTWRFECWYDNRYDRQEVPVNYFDIFDVVRDVADSILPGVVIGGCGIEISNSRMEEFLREWLRHPAQPDFLSVYCYPYEECQDRNLYTNFTRQSADTRFLVTQLGRLRETMDRVGFKVPLYVTEWNISLSSRNYIHDSCYKGCCLLTNLIGSLGMAEAIGYWVGSDCLNTYFDSPDVISGGPGLLSKDGICKPSFYAYRFLHRMGRYLVAAGRNYLITASGHFSYYIICFNDRPIDARYYRLPEDRHTPASLKEMLEKAAPVRLGFTLEHLPVEHYTIKTSIMSPQYGSVLHEWLRLGTMTNMRSEDIDYLKRICTPHMFVQEKDTEQGELSFDIDLDAQEIALIHIYHK